MGIIGISEEGVARKCCGRLGWPGLSLGTSEGCQLRRSRDRDPLEPTDQLDALLRQPTHGGSSSGRGSGLTHRGGVGPVDRRLPIATADRGCHGLTAGTSAVT